MAWTIAQLEAIERAIQNGSTRIRYENRDITYRSLDEMLRIRDLIRNELGLIGNSGGRTYRYGSFSKGLE